MKCNIYDFDGTLYKGDSSIDFFLYCLKKKKKNIKYLPKIFFYMILKMIGIISTKRWKEVFFSFVKNIDHFEEVVSQFWEKQKEKINQEVWETMNKKECNYIISASPEFLLKPYLEQFDYIKLIATNMDSQGKIKGENCKGEEKVKRLHQIHKNITIKNFYSDSLADLPLANLAENAYFVKKGKIQKWNTNQIRKYKVAKKSLFLFAIFFLIYFILGVLLSYNFDFTQEFDLLFDSDTPRVISNMTGIFSDCYRITVHPLFIIFIQPIIFVLKGITQNDMLALIIFSSTISSLSVTLLYKTISIVSKNDKINLLLALCYGLTFSNIVFTAGIELYNIATFFLLLFWYFIVQKLYISWKKPDLFIFVFLGITTVAITITNYFIFLIGCFVLFISKKVSFKKLFLANVLVILSVILISLYQHMIWQITPVITDLSHHLKVESGFSYMDLSFQMSKVITLIKNDFYHAFLATGLEFGKSAVGWTMITFRSVELYNIAIISLFFISIFVFVIKKFKNKKNFSINIGLLLALLFNVILHIFYGNDTCFLYSLHFVYLYFLLAGINYSNDQDNNSKNKVFFLLLIVLLISELLINSRRYLNVLTLVSMVLAPNYYALKLSTPLRIIGATILGLLLVSLVSIIIILSKKLLKKEDSSKKAKYMILIFTTFIILETIFVSLQTIPVYQILGKQ